MMCCVSNGVWNESADPNMQLFMQRPTVVFYIKLFLDRLVSFYPDNISLNIKLPK